MQHVKHKSNCRLCGSSALELVLPILPSAIGDAFVSRERVQEKQEVYPLDCYLCLDCGHLQNLDVVDPEILFRNIPIARRFLWDWWSTSASMRDRLFPVSQCPKTVLLWKSAAMTARC